MFRITLNARKNGVLPLDRYSILRCSSKPPLPRRGWILPKQPAGTQRKRCGSSKGKTPRHSCLESYKIGEVTCSVAVRGNVRMVRSSHFLIKGTLDRPCNRSGAAQ